MENNFNLKRFLIENKLTPNSKLLSEQEIDIDSAEQVPVNKAFFDEIKNDLQKDLSKKIQPTLEKVLEEIISIAKSWYLDDVADDNVQFSPTKYIMNTAVELANDYWRGGEHKQEEIAELIADTLREY